MSINMGIGVTGAPVYPASWSSGSVLLIHPAVYCQGVQTGMYSIHPYVQQVQNYPVAYPNVQPIMYPQQVQLRHPSSNSEPSSHDTSIVICRRTDDGSVQRNPKRPFSRKVFIGNIPHWGGKETEFGKALECIFRRFGAVEIHWPTDDVVNAQKNSMYGGFIFLVYEKGGSILKLLKHCVAQKGELYMDLGKALDSVYVHIRMWFTDDAVYCPDEKVMVSEGKNAIVLGRVPRSVTAYGLAQFMKYIFGTILRVEIEVDPVHKYPKGSAVIHFETNSACRKAIAMRRINMEPLVERNWMSEIRRFVRFGGPCDGCEQKPGTKYCTKLECSEYYCDECWLLKHSEKEIQGHWPFQEYVVAGEVTDVAEPKKQDGEQETAEAVT